VRELQASEERVGAIQTRQAAIADEVVRRQAAIEAELAQLRLDETA
jgi:hypothetical protein